MGSFIRFGLAGAAAAAMAVVSATASAAAVTCPIPLLGGQNDRQYRVDPAVDCVFGEGNIGTGNSLQDDFLQGNGTNEDNFGTPSTAGATFGLTWSAIFSTPYNGGFGATPGLTLSNVDGNSFDWTVTNSSYANYALGLKDGGEPKWAVFLLDNADLSGSAEILTSQGSWSHLVLYGAGTPPSSGSSSSSSSNGGPPQGVSEPASSTLALLGVGLLAAALRQRRKASGN
jgi:hypothetical protein